MDFEDVLVPAADDISLHAWLFRPPVGDGPFPAITMAHGFGGVKYRGLQGYAERFSRAGFVVLVHDHRGFGLSGGEPRGDIDPWQQVADWRRAISFLETLDDVDVNRIGIWGSSYAGGHSIVLAATDRRIKAAVAQIPTISGYEQSLRRVPPDRKQALEERFDADERGQLAGRRPEFQLLNSLDPGAQAAYHSQGMDELHASFPMPPGVEKPEHITLRSTRKAQMYEPGAWIARVSPTPLLMVVAKTDTVTLTDLALAAYGRALEPKRLAMYVGDHFDAYMTGFETTSKAATDWFREHLAP
ncbi:alpha/beta hydrolase [Streptantibioticus ferralitis]|uniref:Alpha/beta hydrolase n=1 Tax=Streptantibioticus ferralitis TaxID=236510 RepID=A0ABT5Z4W2_9ACTN|nr:alpha/beta hydrolase [Streptantibioticus ferralitis]MDF2258866.1 alpha/beta hydrolase [Streptantibioticus ferralitis]